MENTNPQAHGTSKLSNRYNGYTLFRKRHFEKLGITSEKEKRKINMTKLWDILSNKEKDEWHREARKVNSNLNGTYSEAETSLASTPSFNIFYEKQCKNLPDAYKMLPVSYFTSKFEEMWFNMSEEEKASYTMEKKQLEEENKKKNSGIQTVKEAVQKTKIKHPLPFEENWMDITPTFKAAVDFPWNELLKLEGLEGMQF